jgi:uncharacterized small protein (DUF1192 family)
MLRMTVAELDRRMGVREYNQWIGFLNGEAKLQEAERRKQESARGGRCTRRGTRYR